MMSRRRSVVGDEEIVIKPSAELFPDEYDISKKPPTVHIFLGTAKSDKQEGSTFKKTLNDYDYNIPDENVHYLQDTELLECLDKIRDTSKEASGLIFLFCGSSENQDCLSVLCRRNGKEDHISLQEIWSKFTSYNCEHLRNKPKIFIFQIFPISGLTTDGFQRNKYDVPAEADIAIIYNKQDEGFFPDFITNLQTYGNHEDILFLASAVGEGISDTLVISTLTKKFYIAHNEARGQMAHILQYSSEITEKIDKVTEMVKEILPKEKPATSKKTLLTRWESFTKKTRHAVRSDKDKGEKMVAKEEKTKETKEKNRSLVDGKNKAAKDNKVITKKTEPVPSTSMANPTLASNKNNPRTRKGSISENRPGQTQRRRRNSQSKQGSQNNLKNAR